MSKLEAGSSLDLGEGMSIRVIPSLIPGIRKAPAGEGDLIVVNSARVSFAKERSQFVSDAAQIATTGASKGSDESLIRYLIKHRHFTPLTHVRQTFRVNLRGHTAWKLASVPNLCIEPIKNKWNKYRVNMSLAHLLHERVPFDVFSARFSYLAPTAVQIIARARQRTELPFEFNTPAEPSFWPEKEAFTVVMRIPVFVARQLMRSTVEISYNEESRRYVDFVPEIWTPVHWRSRPTENIKQGSSANVTTHVKDEDGNSMTVSDAVQELDDAAIKLYANLIRAGVAPELARTVLPLAHFTSLWATFSTDSLARVNHLRIDPHAQLEIQKVGRGLRDLFTRERHVESDVLTHRKIQSAYIEAVNKLVAGPSADSIVV